MRKIARALNYQVLRDYYTIIVCLIFAGAFVISMISTSGQFGSAVSGGEYFAVTAGEICPMAVTLFVLLISARICGWDFADKTANYEILSGHRRSDVYFGRILASLAWCIPAGIIIMTAPYALFSVINGWGKNLDIGAAALRLLLALFPLFRMICEYSFLTLLLKNFYTSIAVGYLLMAASLMVQLITAEAFEITLDYISPYFNMMKLFDFNYRLGFVDGKDIYIYDGSVPASLAVCTIGVSLGVGAALLALGYHIFRKTDMN